MTTFDALADTLRRLAAAVRPLTLFEFTRRSCAVSGSVGEHVRHCLDHVGALERGMAIGEVCYDHRERNTVVERDPLLAVSRLQRAAARLGGVRDDLLDRPLMLTAQIHEDGRTLQTPTTAGRELAFVISHTVHHSALIAVLLDRSGIRSPHRLGIAPTTPTFRSGVQRSEASCAR